MNMTLSRAVGRPERWARVGKRAKVPMAATLFVLLVPAAAIAAGRTPTVAGAASPSAACTNTTMLDSWPLVQLARQTIAFPAEEAALGVVAPAARAGYGGILLFGTTAPATLGAQLASLRHDVPHKLGLIVMTDEEGGGVQRMPNLVGSMPWASQMGAAWAPPRIKRVAQSVARKMLLNGVDMDLAPVLDVDGRPVEPGQQDPDGFRSFSGVTSVVTADGVAFMDGMIAGGVIPVVKHFPGLGGVSQNTDDGPAHTLRWKTLEQVALPPFEAAIKAGAPALMVSNASVPGFTSLPASLSPRVVRELRGPLGFKGLIVTDSLSAGAIADPPLSLSVPQASVDALVAGDNMVLFGSTGTTSGDLAVAARTATAIVTAVNDRELSKAVLVNAAAQVLAAKKIHLCPPAHPADPPAHPRPSPLGAAPPPASKAVFVDRP